MQKCKEFQQFCDEVAENISDYLLQFQVDCVHLETVTKNNGVCFTGLVVATQGTNVAPNIYLEYYYERYRQGESMGEILSQIADEYQTMYSRIEVGQLRCGTLDSPEERLFLKLINFEKNEELLQSIPYLPFFDMAITFRYLVYQDERGVASTQLRNVDLERFGMTMEELMPFARENTLRFFPVVRQPIHEVINNLFQESCQEEPNPNLYVLTNETYVNGATLLLFPELLLDFAEFCGGDFFIIPSSIHEVLLCPKSCGMSKEFLESVLVEANQNVVSEMDFLSNFVYRYDAEKEKIVL